jgi:transposase-like protein
MRQRQETTSPFIARKFSTPGCVIVTSLSTNNRELKRRTRVVSIFPNDDALLRLASSVLMEVDEGWMSGRKYLTMETQ